MKTTPWKLVFLTVLFTARSFAGDLPAGTVIGWGFNVSGTATGIPTASQYAAGVVAIAGQLLTNAVAISAGSDHSLAIKSDGTIVGWGGDNPFGVRTMPGTLSNSIAASAGDNLSLALEKYGTVTAWGDNRRGQTNIPVGLSNVVAIAAGFGHGLALKKDGVVTSWGDFGRLPPGLTNVVAIAASKSWGGPDAALKRDGTVVAWDNRTANTNTVIGLSNVAAIAVGDAHILALKKDGTVFGWGNSEAIGIPPTGDSYFSSGLVTIGGQVLSNVVATAAGNRFSLALKRDGTVIAWGNIIGNTTDVPVGLSNVVAIAAGDNFCLAITTNKAVAERFRQK